MPAFVAPASSTELQAQLLTTDQLPGYSQESLSALPTADKGCFGIYTILNQTSAKRIGLARESLGREVNGAVRGAVDELIASYPSAAPVYLAITDQLNACHQQTIDATGGTVHLVITPVTGLPTIGEFSQVYSVAADYSNGLHGISYTGLVLKGTEMLELTYGLFTSPQEQAFEAVLQTAAVRMPEAIG
jgi:hypothetical protein